jgi:hypothetical protein
MEKIEGYQNRPGIPPTPIFNPRSSIFNPPFRPSYKLTTAEYF